MTLRDKRKKPDYWEEARADKSALIEYLSVAVRQKLSDKDDRAGVAAGSLLEIRYQDCLLRYSVGEPVAEVAQEAIDLLCDWFPAYVAENGATSLMAIGRPVYDQINRYFATVVLSAPTVAEAKRFVSAYEAYDYTAPPAPGHVDPIHEAMASYLVPGREQRRSDAVNWPEAYAELWLAIAPDTSHSDRIGHLGKFLDGWYDKMAAEMAAQTATHNQKAPNYVGYWCLEAAAAAVMADIDDSIIRGHDHYPSDWADWARGQRA
jgi:Domain of unknown function (DUF1911)